MSDVWQGPGWWLASDGKWYPEDAKSGAVYEGDIPASSVEPEEEVATPEPDPTASIAAVPIVPTADQVEPRAAEPIKTEPPAPIAEAVAAEPVAPEPEVFEPQIMEAAGEATSGWQAIEPTESDAAEQSWTPGGAFAAPVVEVPESAVSEVQNVGIPEVPEVEIAQVEVTQVEMTPVEILDATAIDAPITDIPTIEAHGVPTVQAKQAPIPDIEIPEVQIPKFEIPEVDAPTVSEASPFAAAQPATTGDETVELTASVVEEPIVASGEFTAQKPSLSTEAPPIERTDAWRTPLSPSEPAASQADLPLIPNTPPRPAVVDLAIPDAVPSVEAPPNDRNWSFLGLILAVLLLVAIVWLASVLFSSGGSDDTASDEPAETGTGEVIESEQTEASTEEEAVETDDFISVFDLRQGDCIRGDISGQILEVERVDCAESHDFEVYIERLIDDSVTTEYDEEIITAFSEDVCRSALAELVSPEENPSITFKFLQPTQDSWNAESEDRLVTCLGFDEDGPLEGRIDDE